jgi:hypothetical protein
LKLAHTAAADTSRFSEGGINRDKPQAPPDSPHVRALLSRPALMEEACIPARGRRPAETVGSGERVKLVEDLARPPRFGVLHNQESLPISGQSGQHVPGQHVYPTALTGAHGIPVQQTPASDRHAEGSGTSYRSAFPLSQTEKQTTEKQTTEKQTTGALERDVHSRDREVSKIVAGDRQNEVNRPSLPVAHQRIGPPQYRDTPFTGGARDKDRFYPLTSDRQYAGVAPGSDRDRLYPGTSGTSDRERHYSGTRLLAGVLERDRHHSGTSDKDQRLLFRPIIERDRQPSGVVPVAERERYPSSGGTTTAGVVDRERQPSGQSERERNLSGTIERLLFGGGKDRERHHSDTMQRERQLSGAKERERQYSGTTTASSRERQFSGTSRGGGERERDRERQFSGTSRGGVDRERQFSGTSLLNASMLDRFLTISPTFPWHFDLDDPSVPLFPFMSSTRSRNSSGASSIESSLMDPNLFSNYDLTQLMAQQGIPHVPVTEPTPIPTTTSSTVTSPEESNG